MHEKLIRGAALTGFVSVIASLVAFAWRAGVYHCPVPADGCDVPVRTSNHPYIDLGIALLVVGILAFGAAVALRRRTSVDDPLAG